MRATRALAIATTALALAGLAACGGDDEGSGSSTTVSTIALESEKAGLLLTVEDLATIEGLGGLTPANVSEQESFENPDPRGPCGGKVSKPPLDDAFGRTFQGGGVVAIELIADVGADEPEFLDELRADAEPGCGAYETETGAGAEQTVDDIEIVDVAPLGVPAVGWTSTVETEGQKAAGGVLCIHVGERLVFLQVVTAQPLTPAQLQEVGRLAITRVQGA
jgi:hypothetical protein